MSASVHPVQRARSADAGSCDALLRRIATGDRAALADLYDRLAPAVFAVARRRTDDDPTAEHLVQAVFEAVWRSAPRFAGSGATAAAWVLAVLDDRLRRRAG